MDWRIEKIIQFLEDNERAIKLTYAFVFGLVGR